MKKRKIAFLFYETRDINTYPSITNAIRILVQSNYYIDVYLSSSMKTSIRMPDTNFIDISEQNPYKYVTNTIKYIRVNKIKYDFIFAFSYEGLIISSLLNKSNKKLIPTIYFSMELIYENLLFKLIEKLTKKIFRIKRYSNRYLLLQIYAYFKLSFSGSNYIIFSIIQDIQREKILRREFNFVKKVIHVPNSYIGFSDDSSDYAYKEYDIPLSKKIILFTGGVEEGFDMGLFNITRNLSPDYILFINSYSRDGYLNKILPYYEKEINDGKLLINQITLSEKDYDLLVKSSHICIAWYSKIDKSNHNMYYMGFSSGKLNKYLSCGKPVIAPNYFFRYEKIIDGNQIGRTCANSKQIISLINEIEGNYNTIINNIKKYYSENIEFKKQFNAVIDSLLYYEMSK